MTESRPSHLYLHVPFCASICGYCDFAHVVYRHETVQKWLDAVQKEIACAAIPDILTTVYIGGGTPTSLDPAQLDQLLSMLDPYVHNVREYTIEINPETLDETKCAIIASHGINRASIGFQTGDHRLLKLMGRHHTMDDMHTCVHLLKGSGIDNISLDLMYSLPFQTMDNLRKSIDDALSLDPTHLSLYSLTIEENTIFGKKGYDHLDEDTEADMYEMICSVLPEHGFMQYEVSNFAKDGKQSLHNTAYWEYEDFIGIGCGASGKENHRRYDHTSNVNAYISDPFRREYIPLDETDEMFERLMMGIRMKQGMDLSRFEKAHGIPFEQVYGKTLHNMLEQGWMEIHGNRLCASEKGYEIMNTLLVEFLDS
ncbi:MAG: radical SAM family heme chaperone HemW [Bulleidia sp.]